MQIARVLLQGSAEFFDVMLQFFIELNISTARSRTDLAGAQPVSAPEIGIFQIGAAQVRFPENAPLQVSRMQVRPAKIGFDQQSIMEFCALQAGPREFRRPQISSSQVSKGAISLRQIGFTQVGALETRELQRSRGKESAV